MIDRCKKGGSNRAGIVVSHALRIYIRRRDVTHVPVFPRYKGQLSTVDEVSLAKRWNLRMPTIALSYWPGLQHVVLPQHGFLLQL